MGLRYARHRSSERAQVAGCAPLRAGNDTDEAKTVEESLDHRAKLRLMAQFMAGVATYIVAHIAAILLPLFFVSQPGQVHLSALALHSPPCSPRHAVIVL